MQLTCTLNTATRICSPWHFHLMCICVYPTWVATHRKLHTMQQSAQPFPTMLTLRLQVANHFLDPDMLPGLATTIKKYHNPWRPAHRKEDLANNHPMTCTLKSISIWSGRLRVSLGAYYRSPVCNHSYGKRPCGFQYHGGKPPHPPMACSHCYTSVRLRGGELHPQQHMYYSIQLPWEDLGGWCTQLREWQWPMHGGTLPPLPGRWDEGKEAPDKYSQRSHCQYLARASC